MNAVLKGVFWPHFIQVNLTTGVCLQSVFLATIGSDNTDMCCKLETHTDSVSVTAQTQTGTPVFYLTFYQILFAPAVSIQSWSALTSG